MKTENIKSFDDVICLSNPDKCELCLDKGWAQGRTMFGGVVAAAVYSKVQLSRIKKEPVRSLHYIFSAPCKAGHLDLSTNLVSSGKNVEIYSFLAAQNTKITLSGNAVFGKPLNKNITKKIFMPQVPWFEKLAPIETHKGITPDFMENFEMRPAMGQELFSGQASSESAMWIKFKNSNNKTFVQHIIALIDAIPPPVLQMLDTQSPVSTISLSIQVLDHEYSQSPTDFWLVYSCADYISYGYAHITTYVFDQKGNAAAVGNQTLGIFNPPKS